VPKKTPELQIDVAEVVNYLRLTGGFTTALAEVVKRRITADAAKKQGTTVSSKELQRAADIFRIDRGLFKAKDTEGWLKSNGLSLQAFEEYLETSLLVGKFKNELEKKTNLKKYISSAPVKDTVREMAYQDWFAKAVK